MFIIIAHTHTQLSYMCARISPMFSLPFSLAFTLVHSNFLGEKHKRIERSYKYFENEWENVVCMYAGSRNWVKILYSTRKNWTNEWMNKLARNEWLSMKYNGFLVVVFSIIIFLFFFFFGWPIFFYLLSITHMNSVDENLIVFRFCSLSS